MKVLVVGCKGNLGSELMRSGMARGFDIRGTDREDLDVTNTAELDRFVKEGRFDAIMNAVAFNNVDAVEDPAFLPVAKQLNVEVPRSLARLAAETNAKFVHYSSDYVFSGTKPEGYSETDEPDPISRYGETKRDGEIAVREVGVEAYIVRTSKLFGLPGQSSVSKPGFLHVMHKLSKEKPELSIVDEEVGSPTYTRHLAEATFDLILSSVPGTYHLVNEGPGVTWYGFADEFFKLANITTPRAPISSSAFPKPAQRPKFAMLINTKAPKLPSRIDALKEYIESL